MTKKDPVELAEAFVAGGRAMSDIVEEVAIIICAFRGEDRNPCVITCGSCRKNAKEAIDAVLEEAAAYCEQHIMAMPYRGRDDPGKIAGWVPERVFPTGAAEYRHPGMGYAAAIRAMKGTDHD